MARDKRTLLLATNSANIKHIEKLTNKTVSKKTPLPTRKRQDPSGQRISRS